MELKGRELPSEFWGKKGIGSHLTWIQDDIPNKEQVATRHSDTMEGYILTLIKAGYQERRDQEALLAKTEVQVDNILPGGNANLEDEDEDNEEEGAVHTLSPISTLAVELNIAALYAYISFFEGAERHLIEARTIVKDLNPGHQTVGAYFVEVLQISIEYMKTGNENNYDNDFCTAENLLQLDDKPTLAVIAFFKGRLGEILHVRDSEVLKRFSKAAELEPTYYVWHHNAFEVIRRIRRYQRYHNQIEREPSFEEEKYCITAYKLRPDEDFITILDYALLLKESLWGRPEREWEERKVALCIKLFMNALERATEMKKDELAMWIKVYWADFLVFGKGKYLDQHKAEGKDLLDKCVKDYPTSSTVYHKAGKLYCHGLRGSHLYKDVVLGKTYLENGLACCPRNFPCLMDYIRLLTNLDKIDEVVRTIDKYIKLMFRDFQIGKLHILRGCTIWQFNPFNNPDYQNEASDSWLMVLDTYTTVTDELYAMVKQVWESEKNTSHLKCPTNQDRLTIVEHLELRKSELASDETKPMKLQAFISAIQAERKDKGLDWSSVRQNRQNDTRNSNLEDRFSHFSLSPGSTTRSSYHGGANSDFGGRKKPQATTDVYRSPQLTAWKRQQNSHSLADDDGNWRKKD